MTVATIVVGSLAIGAAGAGHGNMVPAMAFGGIAMRGGVSLFFSLFAAYPVAWMLIRYWRIPLAYRLLLLLSWFTIMVVHPILAEAARDPSDFLGDFPKLHQVAAPAAATFSFLFLYWGGLLFFTARGARE